MENSSNIIIGIVVFIIIFFLLREIMCWYWKINKLVDLLEANNDYLKTIVHNTTKENLNTITNTNPITEPELSVNDPKVLESLIKGIKK